MAPWPYPFWIAHRGAGKLAPENTLAAFRVGASHGYRAFECDVKLSADGVPFLLHDATLQRTTRERGVAAERTWAELSRIDAGSWHGRTWAGEAIPSFDTIAGYCLRNGHALNVEIKPTPGLERETGLALAREAARRAVDFARAAGGGADRSLVPVTASSGTYATPVELDPFAVSLEDKLDHCLRADSALSHPEVIVRSAFVRTWREQRVFVSSEGAATEQQLVECGGGIDAVATDGHLTQTRSWPSGHTGSSAQGGWEVVTALRLAEEALQTSQATDERSRP
jgi:hypothetical protein